MSHEVYLTAKASSIGQLIKFKSFRVFVVDDVVSSDSDDKDQTISEYCDGKSTDSEA